MTYRIFDCGKQGTDELAFNGVWWSSNFIKLLK